MGGVIRVNVELFRSFVPRFQQLQGSAQQAHTKLTNGLDAEGECWGADETGGTFASGYVPKSTDVLEAVAGVAKLFEAIAGKVATNADEYQRAEEANKRALDSIDPGTGG